VYAAILDLPSLVVVAPGGVIVVEDVGYGVLHAVLSVADSVAHTRGDAIRDQRRGYPHHRGEERKPCPARFAAAPCSTPHGRGSGAEWSYRHTGL
jgi:hypothetical protein